MKWNVLIVAILLVQRSSTDAPTVRSLALPFCGSTGSKSTQIRRDLSEKIRSYLSPNFSANFTDFCQLVMAVSRLYRIRFLQPNTHFAAFFEIFKIIIPSHRSKFNILANFPQKVLEIFKISLINPLISTFSSNFAQILMKIHRNFAKLIRECQEFMKIMDIWWIPTESEHYFDYFWRNFDNIPIAMIRMIRAPGNRIFTPWRGPLLHRVLDLTWPAV